MSDSAAWFVNGTFLFREWQGLHRDDRLDYLLLRRHLERKFQVRIADAYYFNADPDLLGTRNNLLTVGDDPDASRPGAIPWRPSF